MSGACGGRPQPDERQFVPVLVLAGAAAFRKGRGTPGSAALFWLGYLSGLAAYAMILRSTLLGLAPTFMYLMWPAVCGALAMLNARDKCGAARRAQGAICLGSGTGVFAGLPRLVRGGDRLEARQRGRHAAGAH